jgi:hypothetical protein
VRVLYVYDSGCNIEYLSKTLKVLEKQQKIKLITKNLFEYDKFIQNYYDVLIYQTYPEVNHRSKFNGDLIKRTDRKFLLFQKHKILFDAHDDGDRDAFERFDKSIPRIKNAPSFFYYRNYNVILETTYPISIIGGYEQKKDGINYSVTTGRYHHNIRENVKRVLELSGIQIDMQWRKNYRDHLNKTLICIAVPGYGEGTFRHLEALNAGCLLLAYDTIEDIQLLPHEDLIPDEDYVLFNEHNLEEKLKFLLKNRNVIDKIRLSGQKKFFNGYSYEKSAEKLFERMGEL